MSILIVAATPKEVQPFQEWLQQRGDHADNKQVSILITGVGGVATGYHLTKEIIRVRPGCVIQAGIAGSFGEKVAPGDVVAVASDAFGDMGAMEASGFADVFDLNLTAKDEFPFNDGKLPNPHSLLLERAVVPLVKAVTINEITTERDRIETLKQKYHAAVESMEGAAFHYVCLLEHIPFIQVRAISNFVGERDKTKWMMKAAIDNLNTYLKQLVGALAAKSEPL